MTASMSQFATPVISRHCIGPVKTPAMASDNAADSTVATPLRLRSGGCDPRLRLAMLFQNVDPDVVEALADEFEIFTAERGKVLFAQGDAANHLYVVLSGKVKLAHLAYDGREHLVELLGRSEQFGEVSLLDSAPWTATATVVTDARIARVPAPVLHDWIERDPQLASQLLRAISRRLRRTHADLTSIAFADTPGRVATELLRLASRFGVSYSDEIRIEHDLSQTELAQLVGSSRETVNKILNSFANRGWIRLEPKCVVILDREGLMQRVR
jgi:CRP/FNR family transcriptional regulator, cyclic AMP receptor protein